MGVEGWWTSSCSTAQWPPTRHHICDLLLAPVGERPSALLMVTTNTILVPALTLCPHWQKQGRVLSSPRWGGQLSWARHNSHGQEAKHFCCIWGSGDTSCCLYFSSSAESSTVLSLDLLAGKVLPAPQQLRTPFSPNSRRKETKKFTVSLLFLQICGYKHHGFPTASRQEYF